MGEAIITMLLGPIAIGAAVFIVRYLIEKHSAFVEKHHDRRVQSNITREKMRSK
jgi:hypothetical protein